MTRKRLGVKPKSPAMKKKLAAEAHKRAGAYGTAMDPTRAPTNC